MVLGFAFYDLTLTQVAWLQAASVAVSVLASGLFARRYLVTSLVVSRSWFGKLFSYGKYTFGTNISSMIVRAADSWMLGVLLSPTAVALYNPAIRIANLFEIPAASLASVAFPQAVKRISEEGLPAAKQIYEKTAVFILASILPFVIFVLLFAEPVVVFIAGEEYRASVDIVRVTILYGLVIPFSKQFGIVLDAMGRAKLNMLFVMGNAVINIVLNYFFIRHFDVIGAAYATFTTFVISAIVSYGYLHRHIGVRASNYPAHFWSFYQTMYQLLKGKVDEWRANRKKDLPGDKSSSD